MTATSVPAVDAVLLDLGNVLVFHDDPVLFARLATLGGSSGERVQAALAGLWDPCNRGVLAAQALRLAVGNAAGASLDEETFQSSWSCHFRINHQVMPLVEGLLGRVKVVLVSNTNAAHMAFLRPQLRVLERFDALVLSYELGAAKPDSAIYLEALARAGVAPERAAFFDDVPAYVQAACALGIRGHLFTDALRFREQLTALGLP